MTTEHKERFETLEDYEKEIFKSLQEYYSDDEALNIVEDGNYSIYDDCYNMSDVAYQIVDECGYLNQMPENLRYYFDYEAFGRDLDIEGTFYYVGNGRYIEVF